MKKYFVKFQVSSDTIKTKVITARNWNHAYEKAAKLGMVIDVVSY